MSGPSRRVREYGVFETAPHAGEFTLRDMYEQFENVMKLGPLSKVMAMIPGIPQMGGEGDEGGNRLKRFMYMMDSMTDDELDGRVDLNRAPSRVDRVARGSGTHPMEVQMLLRCHKQFEGVVTKMGKSGLMKGGDEQMVKHGASIELSRLTGWFTHRSSRCSATRTKSCSSSTRPWTRGCSSRWAGPRI